MLSYESGAESTETLDCVYMGKNLVDTCSLADVTETRSIKIYTDMPVTSLGDLDPLLSALKSCEPDKIATGAGTCELMSLSSVEARDEPTPHEDTALFGGTFEHESCAMVEKCFRHKSSSEMTDVS